MSSYCITTVASQRQDHSEAKTTMKVLRLNAAANQFVVELDRRNEAKIFFIAGTPDF
jgi:hypothetical protein